MFHWDLKSMVPLMLIPMTLILAANSLACAAPSTSPMPAETPTQNPTETPAPSTTPTLVSTPPPVSEPTPKDYVPA